MRRIYIREVEYEIIDSMYHPHEGLPLMLPAQPTDPPPVNWGKRIAWAAVIVFVLVVFGPSIGKAQSNVCQFYGVCSGYGPPVTVYQQPPTVIVVPVYPTAPAIPTEQWIQDYYPHGVPNQQKMPPPTRP